MIEKTYRWAERLLADVRFYLLRLSETKDMSKEEREERDFILNELISAETLFRDCRNELCERCGRYKNAHEGACDPCKWR